MFPPAGFFPPFSPALAALAAVLLLCAAAAASAADIEVVALFRDQAVLSIDGARHKLSPGERTPEGVRLVSTDGTGAVLEVDGQERRYPLGSRIQSGYQQAARGEQVQIFRNGDGMFSTVGSINGLPVNFLVDTGATSVAMNAAQARRLGIDFRVAGDRGEVVTASRVEPAFRVMLDSVKVGAIQLRNVEAVVIDGPQPQQTLLGMSFLGRLEMQNDGQRLLLRRKY
ncbi:MAG TPA: TIGR02281 family clan AA aspartic protease [Gammaproteobacteria bacterium]